jgi:hypothetical protein
MMRSGVRPLTWRALDHVPFIVAATGLLLGQRFVALRPLGDVALAVVVLYVLAAIGEVSLPRPGRRRILTYGCWETPLAFALTLRGRRFVFLRDSAWGSAAVPDHYRVYALSAEDDLGPVWTPQPRPGSTYLGDVPMAELHFDHAAGSYVGSDVRCVLRRLGCGR